MDHEQVVRIHDRASGLVGFIAIHSTALGAALGGTRFLAYPDEDAAQADALRLSRAMSYKNALAGLDHGGGKAVLIGDPRHDKTPERLRLIGELPRNATGKVLKHVLRDRMRAEPDIQAQPKPQ